MCYSDFTSATSKGISSYCCSITVLTFFVYCLFGLKMLKWFMLQRFYIGHQQKYLLFLLFNHCTYLYYLAIVWFLFCLSCSFLYIVTIEVVTWQHLSFIFQLSDKVLFVFSFLLYNQQRIYLIVVFFWSFVDVIST